MYTWYTAYSDCVSDNPSLYSAEKLLLRAAAYQLGNTSSRTITEVKQL